MPPLVETRLDDPRWSALPGLAERAHGAVCATLGYGGEVSLLGCDDAAIATLNGAFRGKPTPTNVLSWPAEDLSAPTPGAEPEAPEADAEWGDVALAFDTCAREATEQGKPFEDHVTHLLVHGFLHLLGYDHETDADAHLMEALEVKILATLGIKDPYSPDGCGPTTAAAL